MIKINFPCEKRKDGPRLVIKIISTDVDKINRDYRIGRSLHRKKDVMLR